MPWEKSFDIDTAIDRATDVFWAKGYESTSLTDLLRVTGINKGSFYNAFGSKKKLFKLSLLKYDREQRAKSLVQLSSMNQPTIAIELLFDSLIAQSLADEQHKGCFLVNTALDLPNHDDDTKLTVKNGFTDLELFFQQQIVLGQKTETIPSHIDADISAKGLLSLVVGLRVLARGVFDASGLHAIKLQAMDLIT